jgi:hypothetical protein
MNEVDDVYQKDQERKKRALTPSERGSSRTKIKHDCPGSRAP